MRRIIVIAFVVLLLAALIISGCSKPAPTTPPGGTTPPATTPAPVTVQWKYADFIPPMDTFAKTAEDWAKQLETASNGRIKITFYHAESLVKMPDLFDATAAGTVDFSMIDANLTPAKLVLSGVMTLPMLFSHTSQAQQVMWALLQKYPAFSNEYAPTKVIWAQNPGPTNLFSRKPVEKLADWSGLKVSAVVPIEGDSLKTLGAVPVSLPPVDWFVSLERGIVDAVSADWNGGFIFKINEISKYRMDNFNLTMRVSPIIMNINSYNKLPPDLKAIFDKVTDGLAMSKSTGLAYEDFMANSIKIMKEQDTKVGNPPFYVLPADERQNWLNKLVPIRDKWVSDMKAKNLPADAMLKDLMTFAEQYK